jgi:hypothetical protein
VIAYCDTSALVALALDEPGAAAVRTALAAVRRVACSEIGIVELRAGIARAIKLGRMSDRSAERAAERWESVWNSVSALPVTSHLLQRAAGLAEQHVLRAYDAVHLAAAEILSLDLGRRRVRWICLDRRLDRAAVGLGLHVG